MNPHHRIVLRKKAQVLAALSLALVVLTGCGPVSSSHQIRQARLEMIEAQQIGASQIAVYEMTSAEVYLIRARAAWAEGHYRSALEWAKTSRAFSERGATRAGAAVRGSEVR